MRNTYILVGDRSICKMSNKKFDIASVGVAVIVFMTIAVLIYSNLGGTAYPQAYNETADSQQLVPYNISLSQAGTYVLVNVSNGSIPLDATNYTDYTATTGHVQINDNTSFIGTIYVEYTYQSGSSAVAVILGVVLMIFLVIGAWKRFGVSKAGR